MPHHFARRIDTRQARSGGYTRLDVAALRSVFGRARDAGSLRHVCRMIRIAKRRAL